MPILDQDVFGDVKMAYLGAENALRGFSSIFDNVRVNEK